MKSIKIKKLIASALCSLMFLTGSTNVFASTLVNTPIITDLQKQKDSNENDFVVLHTFSFENQNLDSFNITSENVLPKNKNKDEEKEMKRIFKELGIDKIREQQYKEYAKKGIQVTKTEILTSPETFNDVQLKQSSNIETYATTYSASYTIGTYDAGTYNNYKIRYVYLRDTINFPSVEHCTSKNPIASLINKTFSVALGFLQPVVWVPATYAGISIEDLFSSNVLPNDSMTTQCQEEVYTKIFEIEDKDDQFTNYDYYPYVTTYRANGNVFCRILSKDQYAKPLNKQWETPYATYGRYYYDLDYLKRRTYEAYKGINGELIDQRPYPVVSFN